MKERRKRKTKIRYLVLIGILVLLLAVLGTGAYILSKYTVRTSYVEGNTH